MRKPALVPAKQVSEKLLITRYNTGTPAASASISLRQHLFTFLLEGEKRVRFAGSQVVVKPHQFVLLTAGNCLMSEKAASVNHRYHSLLIFFADELLVDFLVRHADLLPSGRTQVGAALPFLLLEKDAFLTNFTQSLDFLVSADQPVPYELQKLKLEELLLYLALHYPVQLCQLQHLSGEANDELTVRQVVTTHLEAAITVEELAFLSNMSLSTFKRRFARLYGTSPRKWLLGQKMERAAKLLRQDARPASEIYDQLGYENLSSFIQSFKQAYGLTPKQYQLMNGH